MPMSPLIHIERRTLKFNRPTPTIGMSHKNICNTIGFRQPFLQSDYRLGKLLTQPLGQHYLSAHMSHRLRFSAPRTFPSLVSKVQLSPLLWPTTHMHNTATIRTVQHTFMRP